MNEASSKSQSMASRIAYSFGAFGHDMFYGMLSTYFMMFVTGHLFNSNSGGQAAHMVSFITITIMVLRIVELVIDPFIGNVIDKTDTKWGTLSHGSLLVGSFLPLQLPCCSLICGV